MELPYDDENVIRGASYTDLSCPCCGTGLPGTGAACNVPGCPCEGVRGEQARAIAEAYRRTHPRHLPPRTLPVSRTIDGAAALRSLAGCREDYGTIHDRAKEKQDAEAERFEAYIQAKADAELWALGERVRTRFHSERRR